MLGLYPDSDVSSNTLVKPVLAENAERRSQPSFQECTLFVRVVKLGRCREGHAFAQRLLLAETRLEGAFADIVVVTGLVVRVYSLRGCHDIYCCTENKDWIYRGENV